MIIPAILAYEVADIEGQINRASTWAGVNAIQVDFVGYDFAQRITPTINDLPIFSSPALLEAHVMDSAPLSLELYKQKGFSRVIVHERMYAQESIWQALQSQAVHLDIELGIALNPDQLITHYSVLETVNYVLLMSVYPGAQGNTFLPETILRITQLRESFRGIIEVDGGITIENLEHIIRAGAHNVIVGSAIWKAENSSIACNALQSQLAHIQSEIKSHI